jgi:hypothetical protein
VAGFKAVRISGAGVGLERIKQNQLVLVPITNFVLADLSFSNLGYVIMGEEEERNRRFSLISHPGSQGCFRAVTLHSQLRKACRRKSSFAMVSWISHAWNDGFPSSRPKPVAGKIVRLAAPQRFLQLEKNCSLSAHL